jgi:hypothetical protein
MTKKIAATKKKPAAKKTKLASTCKFAFSDKRSCSMPRWSRHRRYCLFHARQEQQLIDADQIGEELAAFSDEFRTNTDLNHALGNLFKAVAQNRIPPRNAAVLAYIGQLLQQNVPNVQNEIMRIDGREGLNKVIRAALDAHDSCEEEEGEDVPVAERSADAGGARPAGGRNVPNFADPKHFPVYQFHPNGDGGDWTVLTEPPPGPAPVYQFHRDGEAGHWTVLAPPQPEPAPKPTEGKQA